MLQCIIVQYFIHSYKKKTLLLKTYSFLHHHDKRLNKKGPQSMTALKENRHYIKEGGRETIQYGYYCISGNSGISDEP